VDDRHSVDRSNAVPETPRRVRCAIYTRKSTEEGLEQAFNSLDAQRESAVAYIQSQKHMGWTLVETRFDDGGFSGGNMERPALQQLLEQIDGRQVDCVLVYKVDRLSRSLLDFARLMDRFDQRSVSFVSVTQQFNTTTSLGRLTLNILLSFAQFERDLVSERTRDKMGAARRKGKWMGGTPLLGYEVAPAGGRLIVNSGEARRVNEIFELYRTHRSLAAVVAELAERGWTTKSWKSRSNIRHAGHPFTKASLRMLLSNATYCGKVNYRGVEYPGEHKAIIEPTLWEEINRDFSARSRRPESPNAPQGAALSGLLICKHCQQPMIATYSAKKRRYRYYVCQTAREKGWKFCATKSVSADLLEGSIVIQLRSELSTAETRQALHVSDSQWQALVLADAEVIPAVMPALIERIDYDGPTGEVAVRLLAPEGFQGDIHALTFEYKIPRRRGRALPAFRLRSVIETLARPPRLARLLVLGHKLEGVIRSGKVKDYAELARLAHISSARIGQIVMLSLLAPTIQEHILFLPAEHAGLIHERELREIARQPRWDLQQVRFDELLAARS
jgi:DNA invertase Pin-like site-specific DNA recombinase